MIEAGKERTSATKSTQSARKVRGLVKAMYSRAHEAREKGQSVAYCMMGCSYEEILLAMDIVPIWTENYAGLCATKRDAERFLVAAEADGYSSVICGYVRTGLGFDALRRELGAMPPSAPDGGMAEPDMLLGSSAQCDPRFKWYQSLGRYKDTPVYSFDVLHPPVDADLEEVAGYYVRYQTEQLRGLVDFLEKQTGRKMDYDRLGQIVNLADQTLNRWFECDQLRKAVPSPMPTEDHFNIFVPATFLLGTPEALNFYNELYDELKQRVDNGIGVIPDEKYRLLWAGGLPPWHTMWIFNYFEGKGAVFAAERAYRLIDRVEIPAGVTDPLEHIAWRALLKMTQRFDKARKGTGDPVVEHILELIKDYRIDGMVMHATRSCRATTIGQIYLKTRVTEHTTIPVLFLVSDLIDVRDYSEAQWRDQINAFLETVASNKNRQAVPKG